ncbi:right-handed parallel beta-helix repeat-containing protein [Zobellia galactanivorans]|uniref:right-handed parallel beta-helix repeat-containing protein n=1 Tax=Zobellia galactanivorans (strain DSM 12802 / CCUG 47099 / CIP 106680 / NCIMB 13871 / Dsij) TaxID=63186 RepID=UPI001C06E88F|nr:right-handed parallel beta-helix repeat-containing protein [Zobellia galactanivorans]MBU3025542.1 right-handed parallel beta-helix repeat-containing protein [Zobellia galactanivorans]
MNSLCFSQYWLALIRPMAFLLVNLLMCSLGHAQENKEEVQPAFSFPEYSSKYTDNQFLKDVRPGAKFYVGPNGKDNNPGTKNKPFKSLEAARNAIRNLKTTKGLPNGGVEVVVLKGTYFIENEFQLLKEDSGSPDRPVVYSGEASDEVIFSSGAELNVKKLQKVKNEKLLARLHPKARGKVMSIDLTKHQAAKAFKGDGEYGQLAMNGSMLQLAQWPNRGYNHIGEILEEGPTTRWLKPNEQPMPYSKENPTGGKFRFKENLSPSIADEFKRTGDMRVQGYFHNDWYFQNEAVGNIEEGSVQLLHHTRYGIVDKIKSIPRRVRLFNVLAELDEPGEWYFDKKEQRLYVWPIDGFMPKTSRLTVIGDQGKGQKGKSGKLAMISLKNTSNVILKNFVFENTADLAVSIEGGEHNLLATSTVRNGAGKGVNIIGGKYNGITACNFYDLYAAFSISGGDFRSLEHCFNFATNNIIRDCRYRGYGLIGLSGVGIYFAHNLLYNMNGAISYKTVDLLMEYNEFYNIGYEMGDFNVAYCGAQWYTMNNVLRYNFVHHLIEPGGHPVMAFRNDDGGAGLKIYGNVFYRSGRGGAAFQGPLNDYQNNITMDCSVMWWTNKSAISPDEIQDRWKDLSKFGRDLPKGDKGDYLNIVESVIGKEGWLKSPWKEAFPEMKEMIESNPWAQTFCQVKDNYTFKVNEKFHIHGGSGTIEGLESSEVGRFTDLPVEGHFELPTDIDLSVFRDVSSLDFSFSKDFTPKPNFKPIPFDKIGLVNDRFRPNTPDKKKYRSEIYKRFKSEKGGRYNAEIVNARYPLPSYLKP